mmetsp:Transcript_151397/g.484192  ORF Transcript_151397/g.484192 Transcript_151397/m.484192 type:complete len:82 (+) Transcript_151397:411-656(+)
MAEQNGREETSTSSSGSSEEEGGEDGGTQNISVRGNLERCIDAGLSQEDAGVQSFDPTGSEGDGPQQQQKAATGGTTSSEA